MPSPNFKPEYPYLHDNETSLRVVDDTPVEYGGFWRRWTALIIDSVLLSIATFPLALMLGLAVGFIGMGADWDRELTSALAQLGGNIMGFFIGWLYEALFTCSPMQGTLGKHWMGLKVTDLNGERLSFWHATGRFFARMLCGITLCIGYLMAAFTAKKQGLHDLAAQTVVVRVRK